MSLPTFEIAKLVASDAYKQDPSIINSLLEVVLSQPGAIAYVASLPTPHTSVDTSAMCSAWHGLEVQDPQYLHVVVGKCTLAHMPHLH